MKKILSIIFLLFLGTIIFLLIAADKEGDNTLEKNNEVKDSLSSEKLIDFYKKNYEDKDTAYCLKNIDGVGNTELLVLNDNEIEIFSYDKKIEKIGGNDFVTGTIQFFESKKKEYPEVFYSYESGGINYYGCIRIKEKKVTFDKLWNEDYSDIRFELKLDRDKIEYESEDSDLIKESMYVCNNGNQKMQFK